MIHSGRRERIRKRFIENQGKGFAEHELLELLLYYAIPQKDTNVLAHTLIQHFSSFHAVLEADYEDLLKVNGVGSSTALLLSMILPLYAQYTKSKRGDRQSLRTQEELLSYCHNLLRHEKNENFYAISLDAEYRVKACNLISSGSIKEVKPYPRKIVESALQHNAVYLVLCHNHTSKNYLPSPNDEESTIFIEKILSAIEIQLLDHVIVAENIVYTMKHRQAKEF